MKKSICLLLSMVMLLGMLSGCGGSQPEQSTEKEPTQVTVIQSAPDEEIQKAIDLGFVADELQHDYDVQISYAEFCSILDGFITTLFPQKLSDWKTVSANYRDSDTLMSRMEGALVLLYAAECCGVDTVGYEYNIPLEDLIAENVDFYEGVTWNYPLLPDIHKQYFNETLANSENFAWRDGLDYATTAKLLVEYMSYGNGKTYFDYDERYSLNLGKAFTRGDAIRAVERLYENARFALYVPAEEMLCTVSTAAITSGEKMPEVSWLQLPDWNGYTVGPGNWNASHGAGMLYEKEGIEVLGAHGFNFIRAPLDSRMIFKGSDMTIVNPAYLETMDDLIEYCAAEGIHVCFDLHDMPGFYTGGDDSQITLWDDAETQKIFVEFWHFMAEYYKDIPNNLLSFNLLNEPHSMEGGPSDEVYSEIMLKAIEAIREVTPDRLIFVDMLGFVKSVPVQGLVNTQVVQTVHPYFLKDGTTQWPANTINGFVHRNNGVLTLNGSFPIGTILDVKIGAVQGDTTFHIETDGKSIADLHIGTENVGENGCTYIGEQGTGGEFRYYEDVVLTAELTEACSQIKLTQEDGWWYNVDKITITTGAYSVVIIANQSVVPDETAPIIMIDESGNVSAKKPETLCVQSRQWLEDMFETYRKFTEETGTLIMVQEFGFNETIDYQATLAAADDFLSVLDEYDIPWCSWCGNYSSVMDNRDYTWYALWPWGWDSKREGAEYKMVSENWMVDTGLMEVYRKYMNP